MIPRLPLLCLATVTLLTGGCLFSKKSSSPKENPAIAGSVEETFKVRWVEKRSAELVAQGKAAEVARAQAVAEFQEKFAFTGSAAKK